MKLFQYWDTGSPPDEIAACIDSFRTVNPDMQHRLYDRERAAWFIGKQVGQRERRAFEAIAVPSLQSDYFRYCAVWAKGGVYADADWTCVTPLRGFLRQASHGMILMLWNRLISGLLFVREADDPFFAAAIELTTQNIEERRFADDVMRTGGPLVLNALWAAIEPVSEGPDEHLVRSWDDPDLVPLAARVLARHPQAAETFSRFTRLHDLARAPWLVAVEPAYKETPRHWVNWKGSIYRAEE